MNRTSEHPDGGGMEVDEFDLRAAEFALFQRTELLPPRRSGMVARIAEKLGLRQPWDSFVRAHAVTRAKEVLDDYGERMRAEFDRRITFIPETTRSVLDIGCGLAGIDLYIFEHLRGNAPDLYLLDRTRVEDRVWYMFEKRGAFYNSLELAKAQLIRNGVPENHVHCIEAPEDGKLDGAIPTVDLVISTISWGFHYPIGLYLESVARIMSDGAVLLVDVRKGTEGVEALERQFPQSTEVVGEGEKHLIVRCVNE